MLLLGIIYYYMHDLICDIIHCVWSAKLRYEWHTEHVVN